MSRVYTLQITTDVTQQNVILSVTANKKQLINLITQDLISHKHEISPRLTITASAITPVSIYMGEIVHRSHRSDMQVLHDEADCSFIHHKVESKIPRVKVLADDIDIFFNIVPFPLTWRH